MSVQFSIGARNIFTPYFLAPIIFSAIPPIGPTLPVAVIVPGPAMFRPRIKSAAVSFSITPSANISPPLGPPVSAN